METFWLHERADMAEVNDSMVCKFIPKKKKDKKPEAGQKPSGLDSIPEGSLVSDKTVRDAKLKHLDSSVSDVVQTFVQPLETGSQHSSMNNFLSSPKKEFSVCDMSSVSNSEVETSNSGEKYANCDEVSESDGTQRSAHNVTVELEENAITVIDK